MILDAISIFLLCLLETIERDILFPIPKSKKQIINENNEVINILKPDKTAPIHIIKLFKDNKTAKDKVPLILIS